jgi:hypothetical protein
MMAGMRIGGTDVSQDRMVELAQSYAVTYQRTVEIYDLGGDPDGRPGAGGASEPVDKVTLGDIGRLVVFNARLAADDVAALLDTNKSLVLDARALPPDARLEDYLPSSALEAAADAAYHQISSGANIARAKTSKLLHLKRPHLVPVLDSRVLPLWEADALAEGKRLQREHPQYWLAVRKDLIAGTDELARLRSTLSSSDDEAYRRLGRLSALRLLDVIAWSLATDA